MNIAVFRPHLLRILHDQKCVGLSPVECTESDVDEPAIMIAKSTSKSHLGSLKYSV